MRPYPDPGQPAWVNLLGRRHRPAWLLTMGRWAAKGQVTSLTIAENLLTCKGIEDILNLSNPHIGEHQAVA